MHEFDQAEISGIYQQPLLHLVTQAREVHTQNFTDDVELCQLISVKTGGCPEDCAYCAQSIKNTAKIEFNPLLAVTEVSDIVQQAQANGVKRICLGAGYKSPSNAALDRVKEYLSVIHKAGLESCVTLGSLTLQQAQQLKQAGLDYYNHNIDTSPNYYPQIISTRTFQDRVQTIAHVAASGIKVCCGGILGLGESLQDRIDFIHALTQLPIAPDSIPINTLVRIPGTKLEHTPPIDKLELVRTIATVRIVFPQARIRLSAGRKELTELEQALCFLSGANSIFFGDKLLTSDNNQPHGDKHLLSKLGLSSKLLSTEQ